MALTTQVQFFSGTDPKRVVERGDISQGLEYLLFVHTYDVLLAVTGTFSDFPSSRFSLDGSRGPFGRCCWFQLVNY